MNLQQIIEHLDLRLLTEPKDFTQINPTYGYAADLLSCVMAGGSHQGVWVTLQAHNNIIAVAALLDLDAVIITEGAIPDQETINKANEENITLLSTTSNTFEISGKLWETGLRAAPPEPA